MKKPKPKRRYHRESEYSQSAADTGPHCRCGLRLFGTEEIPGQCDKCLPLSAVEYLGRRGEPAPCYSGIRHGGA
jgi:hypothetical protein